MKDLNSKTRKQGILKHMIFLNTIYNCCECWECGVSSTASCAGRTASNKLEKSIMRANCSCHFVSLGGENQMKEMMQNAQPTALFMFAEAKKEKNADSLKSWDLNYRI